MNLKFALTVHYYLLTKLNKLSYKLKFKSQSKNKLPNSIFYIIFLM